ncbi:hypothetical protein H4F49_09890 [Pectobacterium polaris]|nr:hypothetical protein [Pectobacterium polaris]MBN3080951.1 hypothetical protein [Pectobacterium polaris]
MNKPKQSSEYASIWEEKRIPPMEYMTITRASRLFGCESDDFWHWRETGIINILVRAIGGSFAGWAKPKRASDREKVIEDFSNAEKAEIYQVAQSLGIDISFAHPTARRRIKTDGSIEIQGTAYGGI